MPPFEDVGGEMKMTMLLFKPFLILFSES